MRKLALVAVALLFIVSSARAAENETVVTVLLKGKPYEGAKVCLEFTSLLGGVTKDFYTDSKGNATVKHGGTGGVKVFVNGNHSSHRTTGKAPGSITVRLSKIP